MINAKPVTSCGMYQSASWQAYKLVHTNVSTQHETRNLQPLFYYSNWLSKD